MAEKMESVFPFLLLAAQIAHFLAFCRKSHYQLWLGIPSGAGMRLFQGFLDFRFGGSNGELEFFSKRVETCRISRQR
jgi:hypothetical protein